MPPSGGSEPVSYRAQSFHSSCEIDININSKDIKSNTNAAIAYVSIFQYIRFADVLKGMHLCYKCMSN